MKDFEKGGFDKKDEILLIVSANNEVEYATLILGLELCIAQWIKGLNVKGDAMLLIKKI